MINPLQKIEGDRKLSTILNGLKGMFQYGDEFLSIVLYHTEEFDLAVNTITIFMESNANMGLEEVLFKSMTLEEFKEKCLNSGYLDYKKCEELVNNG